MLENARDGVAGSGVLRKLFDRPEAAPRQIQIAKKIHIAKKMPGGFGGCTSPEPNRSGTIVVATGRNHPPLVLGRLRSGVAVFGRLRPSLSSNDR
jgi:hypothetical protein